MNKKENDIMNKPFVITSICREDLKQILDADDRQYFSDEDILKITDERMEWLARKIADGIMENFWVVLRTMIEYRKKELLED